MARSVVIDTQVARPPILEDSFAETERGIPARDFSTWSECREAGQATWHCAVRTPQEIARLAGVYASITDDEASERRPSKLEDLSLGHGENLVV